VSASMSRGCYEHAAGKLLPWNLSYMQQDVDEQQQQQASSGAHDKRSGSRQSSSSSSSKYGSDEITRPSCVAPSTHD